MKQVAKNTRRIANLETRLENMQQLAKVTRVDEAKNLLNVQVRSVELKGIPYLTWRAGSAAKTYWVPEVGEVGMLMCPAGDVGNAVFMPAMFYKDSEAPEADKNIMLRIFADGVEEKWNGNDNEYTLRVGAGTERKTEKTGKIEDKTGTAKLTLERAGTAKIEASPAVKIELTAAGVSIQLSPAVKIDLGLTGITMTAPLVNIIGVLQVGGVPMVVP